MKIGISGLFFGRNGCCDFVFVIGILKSGKEESFGQRLVVEERLEKVAAAHLEVVDLLLGVNAFTNYVVSKGLGEIDHFVCDDAASGIFRVESVGFDLNVVGFQVVKKVKSGLAGAELVQSYVESCFGQRLADGIEDRNSLGKVRLGEFDADKFVVDSVSVDYFKDV